MCSMHCDAIYNIINAYTYTTHTTYTCINESSFILYVSQWKWYFVTLIQAYLQYVWISKWVELVALTLFNTNTVNPRNEWDANCHKFVEHANCIRASNRKTHVIFLSLIMLLLFLLLCLLAGCLLYKCSTLHGKSIAQFFIILYYYKS